jgi:hypothetical protein
VADVTVKYKNNPRYEIFARVESIAVEIAQNT